ncbi:MAG: shikimate dehydrogenase [Polyangiales bacterium]
MLRLALIGRPVSHSRSPAMMRAALDSLGIEGVYTAFEVAPERLGDAVRGLDALGFDGANVTLPHKSAVIEHLARTDATARLIGAVNTLAREGDALVGSNTDVEGLLGALRAHGADPRGGDVVVLGAGGAARAAAVGVARGRAIGGGARAQRASPRATSRDRIAVWRCAAHGHTLGTPESARALEGATLVIQATSCGMVGGGPTDALLAGAPLERCRRETVAMDLVYVPAVTAWMDAANAAGLRVLAGAGAEMLARQGAVALRRWSGREPPLDVMRAALGL